MMPQAFTWPDVVVAFIPLFVAVDPFGLLPVYVALTQGVKPRERVRVIRQSLITAFAVAVVFLVLGRYLLRGLGISDGDFMIAGGLLLFILAIMEIVNPKHGIEAMGADYGVVPLGVPLIAGPAVFTTVIVLTDTYGMWTALAALVLNLVLVGGVFVSSDRLMHWIGESGTKVISKLVSLLLAAIAVMLVRRGLEVYGVVRPL